MRCTNVFLKLLIFPPGIKIRKSTSNFFRFLTCPSKFIIFHETKIKMVGFLKILHIIFASDEYNFFIFICLWKTGTTEPGIENCKAIECINSTNSICSNWCANVILAEVQLGLVKGKNIAECLTRHGNYGTWFDETCHWKNCDKAIGDGQV